MQDLPTVRKRYLLKQHHQMRSASSSNLKDLSQQQQYSASYGPSSATNLIPRLVPQLTGDSGVFKRFSIVGWGAQAPSPLTTEATTTPDPIQTRPMSPLGRAASPPPQTPEASPLVPQTTGGIWSGWFMSSKPKVADKVNGDKSKGQSPEWYVDGLRLSKTADERLAKHLISLRVHLSTAKVAWIQQFVDDAQGMAELGNLLSSIISKAGRRKKLSETEAMVMLEIVKCLRVLLNTEPGYGRVLTSPTLITHIAFTLHYSSNASKLRTLAAEVLAALCVLSTTDGHKLVVAALSDYRVTYEEAFRFEELVSILRVADAFGADGTSGSETDTEENHDDDGTWESKTAVMALVNALTNCPESVEDRVSLREEFGRRGLNEVIVVRDWSRALLQLLLIIASADITISPTAGWSSEAT